MRDIYVFLENKKKEISILKNMFDLLKSDYAQLMQAVDKRNYDSLITYLSRVDEETDVWERQLREFDSPAMAECVHTATGLRITLRDIAHQALE